MKILGDGYVYNFKARELINVPFLVKQRIMNCFLVKYSEFEESICNSFCFRLDQWFFYDLKQKGYTILSIFRKQLRIGFIFWETIQPT
ncbi:MAG: hypothetical protein ACJA1Z_000647 [Patiriisocius sp.]